MSLSTATFIGLRYCNSRKSNQFIAFINGFSVAGIALGLMALIITSSVMNGFEDQLKQRILGLAPHFVVSSEISEMTNNALKPYVKSVSPYIEAEGIVQGTSGLKPVLLQGIDTRGQHYDNIAKNMLRGKLSELNGDGYNIVVGRLLALRLNLSIGDQVRVIIAGSSRYTPLGRVPAQRKFTVSGIFDVGSEMDEQVVLMDLNKLAKLQRGRLTELQQYRLFMHDPFQYRIVRDILKENNLTWTDWRAKQGALFDAVKMEKNMMMLMQALIVAVAAFNIVSALVMVVNEKQADIAILRTQGLENRHVMIVFLVNGVVNGLKGVTFGAIGGLLCATQINYVLTTFNLPIVQFLPEGKLPVVIEPLQITMLITMSVVLCVLAAIFPAWRALSIKPANALRYE